MHVKYRCTNDIKNSQIYRITLLNGTPTFISIYFNIVIKHDYSNNSIDNDKYNTVIVSIWSMTILLVEKVL